MLANANFLEGLNYFIQTIPTANRLEAFRSDSVLKAIEFMMKSQQVNLIMLSIKKQFIYDVNDLIILAIQHQTLNLAEEIFQTYPQELNARKIARVLSTSLNFVLLEKYPLIFTPDVLSYTLDHISLTDAKADVLSGLIKIGATFHQKYTNQDTAEKINRLLTKTKKGKN
jgi:hypothetical protein